MLSFVRMLTTLSAVWMVAALATQVARVCAARVRDYSAPAGSPWRAVVYSFTAGMSPWRKESARLYVLEFGLGLLLHVGVFLALGRVALALVSEPTGALSPVAVVLRGIAAAALLAGVALFIRRLRSPTLRQMSAPDDYLANLATCALLAAAALLPPTQAGAAWLLAYATLLFIYVPLGKLRHVVFFFVARGAHAWRLGYRGTYPPAAADRSS